LRKRLWLKIKKAGEEIHRPFLLQLIVMNLYMPQPYFKGDAVLFFSLFLSLKPSPSVAFKLF